MMSTSSTLPCIHCDADLTGLDIEACCPECKAPVTDTIDMVTLDSTTHTVAIDAHCIKCDYDLRTLAFYVHCPECGTPVAASLRTDDFTHAKGEWRQKVESGLTMLLVAAIGLPSALLITAILPGILDFPVAYIIALVGILAIIVFVFMGIAGLIGIAWKDPPARLTRSSPWPRRLAIAFPVLLFPSLVTLGFSFLMATANDVFRYIAMFAVTVLLASIPASAIGAGLSLQRTASFVHQPILARTCEYTAWLFGGGCALAGIAVEFRVLQDAIAYSSLGAVMRQWGDVLLLIGAIIILIAYIPGIIILAYFRRRFAETRRIDIGRKETAQRDTIQPAG